MKNSTLIIFFLSVILKIQAQSYLISFAGTGAATMVNTIQVENLTSGSSVTLNGADILHLYGTVGVDKLNSAEKNLQIYPNPSTEQSTLAFFAPQNGNTVIGIIDISGKTIYQLSRLLNLGTHSFCLSGFGKGMYFIKVSGNGYNYTTKLLSQSTLKQNAGIEYIPSSLNLADNSLKSSASTIEMAYKNGDRLLYKGISGIYSTIITDVPTSNKTITFGFETCTDRDNNNYTIVKIGNQIWMAENLKTTRYNDGTHIPSVSKNTEWSILSTPGYCWYNNDSINYNDFGGALYNWYSVNSGILAPSGWHIPKDDEWTTLTTNIGGLDVAGGKLKDIGTSHWISLNIGATNEFGFTAIAGGFRFSSGDYTSIGGYGCWWTQTVNNGTTAWYRYITNNAINTNRFNGNKLNGYSVRCVKD